MLIFKTGECVRCGVAIADDKLHCSICEELERESRARHDAIFEREYRIFRANERKRTGVK